MNTVAIIGGSKGTVKFMEKFYDVKTLREGNEMLVN